MAEIFIKIPSDGKVYKADLGNLELTFGDQVLIEYDSFQDVGMIMPGKLKREGENPEVETTIIRKINDKDKEIIEEKKAEAKECLAVCQEKIKKHELTMELLDADLSFDGKKLTFYFTAPGRVDFRSLVPDLASTFKKLIRLQQVISRDKARCFKAIGKCGRETCCRSFLKGELDDVSQEMAFEQNLGQMGSNRVTGLCGRLQCCLKFEYPEYCKIRKSMPEIGSKIKTEEGMGKVTSQNIIKRKLSVLLDKDQRIVEVDC